MTTRPCIDFGSHGPFAIGLGMKASPLAAKKGWLVAICIGASVMARDHDGYCAMKSTARSAGRQCGLPLGTYALVRFSRHCLRGLRREWIRPDQLRQCPDCGAPDQRALVAKQTLGLRREATVRGVADRDQHIADEAVAAGALDRRFCESRAERRVIEPRKLGELRCAQLVARAREIGHRLQFENTWPVGQGFPFGLYEPGDSAFGS